MTQVWKIRLLLSVMPVSLSKKAANISVVFASLGLLFWGAAVFWQREDLSNGFRFSFTFHLTYATLIFCLNYWFLIPRFLATKKYGMYVFLVALCFFLFFFLSYFTDYLLGLSLPKRSELTTEPFQSLLFFILILVLSTLTRFSVDWFRNERIKAQLKTERLNAELAFLKSQINPHFLFNTLNNIYSLVYHNSEKAPEAVLKLAELLRYMLYSTDADRIELSKEISYIKDFISLESLRLSKKVNISFNMEGDAEKTLIAPMLLIPFVENAFKHGDVSSPDAFIDLSVIVTDRDLVFRAENLIRTKADVTGGGIGIRNVRRRLDLLYRGRYVLDTRRNENRFYAQLKITLDD